jgi:hypothetical protein
MPFRRNIERENKLLGLWQFGDTVKCASQLTGIPEGTVSHYYAKFNRKRDKYLKLSKEVSQEPPRSSPFDVALAAFLYTDVLKKTTQLIQTEEYTKARDYLQAIMLLQDFSKRMSPLMQNLDPNKVNESLQSLITLVKITSPDVQESVKISSSNYQESVKEIIKLIESVKKESQKKAPSESPQNSNAPTGTRKMTSIRNLIK